MKERDKISFEPVPNLVHTADGTITLRDDETGELYHNRGGAFLEALENYVLPARLESLLETKGAERSIRMLDVCFGLGYNSFVLFEHILRNQIAADKIEVYALEIDSSILSHLPSVLQQECFQHLVQSLRDENGRSILDAIRSLLNLGFAVPNLSLQYKVENGPLFSLNLHFGDLRKVVPALATKYDGAYDLIFHDPFSPNKVPQLWTVDLFASYFKLLNKNCGRLLTYSAASAVRGGLLEAGFGVFRTKAVGVKTGGTLAVCREAEKDQQEELVEDLIFPLLPNETAKLIQVSGIPYRDPGLHSTREEILKRRSEEQQIYKANMISDQS